MLSGASTATLVEYHNEVHKLSRFLPVVNPYEVEYIIWELWYASTLFKRENYQEAKSVLDALLTYGKTSKEPLVPLCKYTISVWAAAAYLRLHSTSPSSQLLKAALTHLASVANYTQTLPLLALDAPPSPVPTTLSKNPPPLAWTLLTRTAKGLSEVRMFYSKCLSPLRDPATSPTKVLDTTADVNHMLEKAMNALDELVEVGASWDKQISSRVPTHSAAFGNMCTFQVSSFCIPGAQLICL